jgi:hypothetical protein
MLQLIGWLVAGQRLNTMQDMYGVCAAWSTAQKATANSVPIWGTKAKRGHDLTYCCRFVPALTVARMQSCYCMAGRGRLYTTTAGRGYTANGFFREHDVSMLIHVDSSNESAKDVGNCHRLFFIYFFPVRESYVDLKSSLPRDNRGFYGRMSSVLLHRLVLNCFCPSTCYLILFRIFLAYFLLSASVLDLLSSTAAAAAVI